MLICSVIHAALPETRIRVFALDQCGVSSNGCPFTLLFFFIAYARDVGKRIIYSERTGFLIEGKAFLPVGIKSDRNFCGLMTFLGFSKKGARVDMKIRRTAVFFYTIFILLTSWGTVSSQSDIAPLWSWEEEESRDVIALDVSGSGEYVAVGTHNTDNRPDYGAGAYVCLFHRSSNQPVFRYELTRPSEWVYDVKCSYNAETIAFVSHDTLFVLDNDGELLWKRVISRFYYDCLAVSSDGDYIAVANYDNLSYLFAPTVFYFHRDSSEEIWSAELPKMRMAYLDMSADGSRIAAATYGANSYDPFLTFFDAVTSPGVAVWNFTGIGIPANKVYIDLTSDGNYVALEANSNLLFFDTFPEPDGVKYPVWYKTTDGFPTMGHQVKISDDGQYIVYASAFVRLMEVYPGTLELWDTSGGGSRIWKYEQPLYVPFLDGNSDLSVIFLSGDISAPNSPYAGLFVNESQAPVWEQSHMGKPSVSQEGRFGALASGRYVSNFEKQFAPLSYFDFIPNEQPYCTIESPLPDTPVDVSAVIEGSADDFDGRIAKVQVGVRGLYWEAEDISGDDSWDSWRYELDVSSIPNGPLTVYAESIDDGFKHSEPEEITILVDNMTPAPTYTPRMSHTPTPWASPTPTPAFGEEGNTGLYLSMNDSIYFPGDVLTLSADIYNNEESRWAYQIVMLDVFGKYYFHPSWTEELDLVQNFLGADYHYRELLLSAQLPQKLDSLGPLYFMGALLDADNSELLGNISAVSFFLFGN